MANFFDYLKPLGTGNKAFPKLDEQVGNFFTGTPARNYQQSTLGEEQQPLYEQLQAANAGPGAGGSFGTSADYYRDLLNNDSQTFNQLSAPETRRFNEQTIPGLSEQFAGMGSGGLSSSGFRNAAVNAGTDLSERLGAIRANLRQQGAQGLQQMGQFGLGQFNENLQETAKPGLIDYAGPALGAAATAFGGPLAGMAGNAFGNFISQGFKNTSPVAKSGQNSLSQGVNMGRGR